MKITLRNNFHNTEAVVIPRNGELSPRQVNRALKKLCGMKDCCCGDVRGPQDVEITWNGDGSATVLKNW